jgi:hypothetical protein
MLWRALKKTGGACSNFQNGDKLLGDLGTCKSVAKCETTSDCVDGAANTLTANARMIQTGITTFLVARNSAQ